MRAELIDYWRNPPPEDGNSPEHYLFPDGWIRSGNLAMYLLNRIPRESTILELGSGVGRNLAALHWAGFSNLYGIEVSENALKCMRSTFSMGIPIINHSIEETLPVLFGQWDLLFTMAVLEHLPPESENVFAHMVRISKKYILTIEDEKSTGSRHFPRNYKKVFERLGMRQIEEQGDLPTLSKSFRLRFFRKEGE